MILDHILVCFSFDKLSDNLKPCRHWRPQHSISIEMENSYSRREKLKSKSIQNIGMFFFFEHKKVKITFLEHGKDTFW